MSYQIGIDLGTTYTAAAIHRDGVASIFSLGDRSASIPSVVLLRQDETILTGDAAVRRAVTEPERVAREFKRRLGDTTPIIVGGTPYSAEALMARLLRAVLDEITRREGAAPSRIAVSHPANWGPYKHDLFRQAVRIAGLDPDHVVTLSEPEAAAISYAAQERVDEGEIVAVYDLGGGTFDACLLRRTAGGFEIVGKPEGIERLGGLDFDAAVFAHVARSVDGALDSLDPDDPLALAAVSRLKSDCVDAKEALSADTDATIPVLLPTLQTEVRLTRREFESLIRPSLVDSIEAMRRAINAAGVDIAEVSKVLLVGGSSRIPLVAQMVSSELGRPVAVDAHPKHAISLGAAYAAASADSEAAVGAAPVVAPPAAAVPPVVSAPPVVAAPQAPTPAPAVDAPPTPAPSSFPPPTFAPPTPTPTPTASGLGSFAPPTAPAAGSAPTAPLGAPVPLGPPDAAPRAAERPAVEPAPVAPTPPNGAPVDRPTTKGSSPTAKSRVPLLLAIGAVALVVGVGAAIVFSGGGDDDGGTDAAGGTTEVTNEAPADTTTTAAAETTTTTEAAPVADPVAIQAAADAAAFNAGGAEDVGVAVDGGNVLLTGVIGRSAGDELLAEVGSIEGVESVDTSGLNVVEDDEWCSPTVKAEPRWGCITLAVWDGSRVRLEYQGFDGGEPFNVNGGYHYHFFSDELPVVNAGNVAAGAVSEGFTAGNPPWDIWDDTTTPGEFTSSVTFAEKPERYCVRIANSSHALESLDNGNCWPVDDGS